MQKIPSDCVSKFTHVARKPLSKLFVDDEGNYDREQLIEFLTIPKRHCVQPYGSPFRAARKFKQYLTRVVNGDVGVPEAEEQDMRVQSEKQKASINGMNRAVEAARNGYIQQAISGKIANPGGFEPFHL